jgi:hypothetical protein
MDRRRKAAIESASTFLGSSILLSLLGGPLNIGTLSVIAVVALCGPALRRRRRARRQGHAEGM